MAHFFDSCASVLDPTGSVKISLVQGQEKRWDIAVQAKRSGLNLIKVHIFREEQYDGYVCKRNTRGQSFKNVHTKRHTASRMQSCSWEFSRQDSCFNGDLEALVKLVLDGTEAVVFTGSEPLTSLNEQSSTSDIVPLKSNPPNDTSSKDAVESLVSDVAKLEIKESPKTIRSQAPSDLKCPYCSKKLLSSRAYHQHVHMVYNSLI